MLEHTGKLKKVRNGRLCFAEVTVRLADPSPGSSPISFLLSGAGFTSQGAVEEVPPTGYLAWRQGAELGIHFAFTTALIFGDEREGVPQIAVTRILGLSTDTTSSMVAAAAAHAVWQGLGYEPDRADLDVLDRLVLVSLTKPIDWVPASIAGN